MFIKYNISITENPITVSLSFFHSIPFIKKKIIPITRMLIVVVTILNAYIPYPLSDFLIKLNRINNSQTPVDTPQLNSHPKHKVINLISPQVTPHENPIAAIIIANVTTKLFFFFIFSSNHIIQNFLCNIFLWIKRKSAAPMFF